MRGSVPRGEGTEVGVQEKDDVQTRGRKNCRHQFGDCRHQKNPHLTYLPAVGLHTEHSLSYLWPWGRRKLCGDAPAQAPGETAFFAGRRNFNQYLNQETKWHGFHNKVNRCGSKMCKLLETYSITETRVLNVAPEYCFSSS